MAELDVVFWYWWVLAVSLLAIEMLAPGFFFLWMAVAGFATGCVLLLVPDTSFEWQLFLFSFLSAGSIIFWRVYVKTHPTDSDQPLLNQKAAQYIGRTFTLIAAIENGQGRIKIGDTFWKVQGEDCANNSRVKIIAVSGTLLMVEKIATDVKD